MKNVETTVRSPYYMCYIGEQTLCLVSTNINIRDCSILSRDGPQAKMKIIRDYEKCRNNCSFPILYVLYLRTNAMLSFDQFSVNNLILLNSKMTALAITRDRAMSLHDTWL